MKARLISHELLTRLPDQNADHHGARLKRVHSRVPGRCSFWRVTYAGALFWDTYFRKLRESGEDLDWRGRWTEPFLVPLREAEAHTVLELGCGTGNDAARLAGEGYSVTVVQPWKAVTGDEPAPQVEPGRFAAFDTRWYRGFKPAASPR